jgi:hypothetical protein
MKMVALAGVANSFYRTNIIEALKGETGGLSFTDLYGKSMARSDGTFNYHLRELQRLGVLTISNPYTLTNLGMEIAKTLEFLSN